MENYSIDENDELLNTDNKRDINSLFKNYSDEQKNNYISKKTISDFRFTETAAINYYVKVHGGINALSDEEKKAFYDFQIAFLNEQKKNYYETNKKKQQKILEKQKLIGKNFSSKQRNHILILFAISTGLMSDAKISS